MSQTKTTVRFEIPADFSHSAPVPWAVAHLEAALVDRGLAVSAGSESMPIQLRKDDALEAESFGLKATADGIVVTAAEPRGFAYGLSELADIVRTAEEPYAALTSAEAAPKAPAAPVRGVLRSFSSDVLDLGWFRDPGFWTGYLDELAVQRINRVHLALGMQYNYSHDPDVRDNYLCFAYPFLVEVPGWDQVRVEGVGEDDRRRNLEALRYASDEAARRGIHFQLGLWNHAVRPELGESPELRYPIAGLPDEQVPAYSADALRLLLAECPAISGVTFRVHYEGGVPEKDHGAFWRTVMSGLRDAGRQLDVDMHAKGVDAELIQVAREVGAHVAISPKYWAEHQGLPYHQASVRPLERARPANGDGLRGVTQNERRFTRYGYGDFLGEERDYDVIFRVWPGSQRFLIWADPELFAGYGRLSTLGGALGAELCEPLTFRGRKDTGRDGIPRDLYVDESLSLGRDDWKKYAYEYRLWGRLMYDPSAAEETWLRSLRQEFGAAAEPLASALSSAGKVMPLVTVTQSLSASNNFFWPEVFTDMPIARRARSLDTYDFDLENPGTWGTASPFDPQIFETADAYAEGLVSGKPSGRITPDQVASRLLLLAESAEAALDAARASAPDPESPGFRRLAIDAALEALLARFFAGKIQAGVAYSLFSATGDAQVLRGGLGDYQDGRDALARLIKTASGIYGANLAFGDRPSEQGHWSDRLAQVDADIAELARELEEVTRSTNGSDGSAVASQRSTQWRQGGLEHTPAEDFVHGRPFVVQAQAEPGITVELRARHLNQGEGWIAVPMDREGGELSATIPAGYTEARFPIEYFFVLQDEDSHDAWLVPGLEESLANQPYHVVAGHVA